MRINSRFKIPAIIVVTVVLISRIAFASDCCDSTFITPEFTFSPNGRYGVMIPMFKLEETEVDNRKNKVVELSPRRLIAVINADPGYDRQLNFRKVTAPRWSSDSSVLLWKVEGKWNPYALVLIKLDENKLQWQRNLLKIGQESILSRTRQSAPKQYAVAKESNAGNGSGYPDGFTIDVYTANDDSTSITLPFHFHVDLTSNPKGSPHRPTLEAYLDAVINENGDCKVTRYKLGTRNHF